MYPWQTLLPNVVLAAALFVYAFRSRERAAAPVALLVYATLHYAPFTVWALLADPSRDELKLAHRQPVAEARIVGAAFVLVLLGLLAWRNRRRIRALTRDRNVRGPAWAVLGCMAAIPVGFAWNLAAGSVSPASAVDAASMLALVLLAVLLVVDWSEECGGGSWRLLRAVGVLLPVMDVLGLLEVLSGDTFAGFRLPDDTFVGRASASLYNPNVFGLWCAGAAVFAAYLYARPPGGKERGLPTFVLVMAGVGMLLAASRSGLALYLILVLVLLAHSARHGASKRGVLRPHAFVLGAVLLVGVPVALLGLMPSPPYPLLALSELAQRTLLFPLDGVAYALGAAGLLPVAGPSGSSLSGSVGGRFGGDNGYLVVLGFAGPTGLVGWLALVGWTVLLAVRRLWPRPQLAHGYALVAVAGCALSGLLLRSFQLFPVWVYVAFAAMPLCLALMKPPKETGPP